MESTFGHVLYRAVISSASPYFVNDPKTYDIRRDWTNYHADLSILHVFSSSGMESLYGSTAFIALHWLAYCIATALLISVMSRVCGDFSSVFSLSRVSGVDSWLVAAALCSMAGVPPFIGFWTKAALLVMSGCGSYLWLSIACWSVAVTGLLFYMSALRYSVSLKKLNELDDDTTLAEGPDSFSLVIAASLVVGSFVVGDASLLMVSIFA